MVLVSKNSAEPGFPVEEAIWSISPQFTPT